MSAAGKAIHEIRVAADMSPAQLASASELDLTLLERLEAGDEEGVTTADIARVARVLRVDPVDLLTGKASAATSPTVSFRHASYPDFYDVDRVKLIDAIERAHALVAVNRLLGRGAGLRARFQPVAVGPNPWEGGYRLAAEVRAVIGNLDQPLADLRLLLEDRFEVEVLIDRFRTTRIQAVCVKQEPDAAIAILNQANAGYRNPLRRRVDLAHELAHILFDQPNGAINVTVDSGTDVNRAPSDGGPAPEEQRANAFAAELLIPLPGLKRLFGPPPTKGEVSYAAAFTRVQRAREEFKTPKEVAVNHLCWRGYVDQTLHDALIGAVYPHIDRAPERYGRRGVLERRVILASRRNLITSMRARELLGLSVWDDLPDEIDG